MPQQTELEMVTLESLVPADHQSRTIDAVIGFSFIHERVAGLYRADNGRPVRVATGRDGLGGANRRTREKLLCMGLFSRK